MSSFTDAFTAGAGFSPEELNHFYQKTAELWQDDFAYTGFEWVDFRDEKNSIISFRRKAPGSAGNEELFCVLNFTPAYHHEYIIHLRGIQAIEEVFNSDDERYGGSGKVQIGATIIQDSQGQSSAVKIALAPLACMIYRVRF